jgi:ADP-heptose:LPS heptosyltransferase
MIKNLKEKNLLPNTSAVSAISAVNRILVIQLTKMGDFLQTTPLLYRIKQKYPSATLSVLIDRGNTELAQGISLIDEIVPIDLRAIQQVMNDPRQTLSQEYKFLDDALKQFRGKKYDLIYNINFSHISALLCRFFPKIPVIGYRLDADEFELRKDPWVSFIFYLLRDRNLLRLNLVDLLAGYETETAPPISRLIYAPKEPRLSDEILPVESRPNLTIGLQMGCGGNLRKWPAKNFAALAFRVVNDLKGKVVLLGSKDEKYLSDEFFNAWEKMSPNDPAGDGVSNLIGKTSLAQLAEVLRKCDLLVTGDTGTMHLGSAVGTRILALFLGTALAHETGPYGDGHFVIQAETPCFPCQPNSSCRKPICHEVISHELVYEFLRTLVKGPSGFPPREFSREEHPFLKADSRGQIYRSVMDRWGVKFLPIFPKKMNIKDIMAIAYRETARTLMTPNYALNQEEIINEILNCYGFLDDSGETQLERILESLSIVLETSKGNIQGVPVAIKGLEPTPSFGLLSPLYSFLSEGIERNNFKSFQFVIDILKQISSLLEAIYSHQKKRSSMAYRPSRLPFFT